MNEKHTITAATILGASPATSKTSGFTMVSFPLARLRPLDPDRVGVGASIFCAIHCGLAPFLLILMPAFGRIWAHPASHALAALLIVPLASFAIWRGFRRHRRVWVLTVAVLGILLVLSGAALPAFATTAETAASTDTCCPSVKADLAGKTTIHIPPAAIITTLGGFVLIVAHLGNICACRQCRLPSESSPLPLP